MARNARRTIAAGLLATGVGLVVSAARAQDPNPIGTLGGYGAMEGASGSSMGGGLIVDPSGMGAGALVPFGGRLGTTMPARMGGGGSLSFTPRSSAMMSPSRRAFTISPMAGGMSSSGGMGSEFGRRPFALPSLRVSGGMGQGGAMQPVSGTRGMGVVPPSFGYPFRQPPSLVAPSTGLGMSM